MDAKLEAVMQVKQEAVTQPELEPMMEPEKVDALLRSHLVKNGTLKEDKETSWTVRYSSLGGRGLVARRDIEQGELIFVDTALLIGPRSTNKHLPVCVNCYKNDCPLFPCDNGCGLPVCSNECENDPRHVKIECEYLRERAATCGSSWSMDLLRAVVPIRALALDDDQRSLLMAFQCHRGANHGHEVKLLQQNVENAPAENDALFMDRVCRVFDTNAFETLVIHDGSHYTSLRGLYPMGCLQNHSCIPNTRHHFDSEQRLHVTAALPIAEGEEITMTYVDLLRDTMQRRSILLGTKHFECKCHRCCDPSELGTFLGALLCSEDHCSGILTSEDPLNTESPWKCNKCDIKMINKQVRCIRSGLLALVEKIIYESPRDILRFLKKELLHLVPSSNYYAVDMKYRIVSYFGRIEGVLWPDLTDEELAIKSRYCKDVLSILKMLGCGDCKKKGLVLYELYCTNVELLRRSKEAQDSKEVEKENAALLKEAKKILKNDVASKSVFQDES